MHNTDAVRSHRAEPFLIHQQDNKSATTNQPCFDSAALPGVSSSPLRSARNDVGQSLQEALPDPQLLQTVYGLNEAASETSNAVERSRGVRRAACGVRGQRAEGRACRPGSRLAV